MGWFKRIFRAPLKIIKAVVDPIIDVGTNIIKVVVSPFTGAFDIPDDSLETSEDFAPALANIKSNIIVDFNGANRSIPVIYGTQVDIAVIPVFVGVQGDSAGSSQYLYMAGVISQGFHGGCIRQGTLTQPDAYIGARLVRMTINGKAVHMRTGSHTNANEDYRSPYVVDPDGDIYQWPGDEGIFASGLGATQPQTYSITRGTFANRCKIQYFDGSADQPASTLLQEHSDWTTNHKLSGLHYVAMRFELKSADEVINSVSDGAGTYGNPYSGVPSVVVTVQGRNTPNIVAGKSVDPGYEERDAGGHLQHINPINGTPLIGYHKRLDYPRGDGQWELNDSTFVNADETLVHPVDSDTTLNLTIGCDYQLNGSTPNIHDILNDQGWTYPYVWCYPGRVNYSGGTSTYGGGADPTNHMILLKNVGGSHYKFVSRYHRTKDIIIENELTFFGYSNTSVGTSTGVTKYGPGGHTATYTVYRFYTSVSNMNLLANAIDTGDLPDFGAGAGGAWGRVLGSDDPSIQFSWKDRPTGKVYTTYHSQTNVIGIAGGQSDEEYIDIWTGRHDYGGSAGTDGTLIDPATLYQSIPDGAEIYITQFGGVMGYGSLSSSGPTTTTTTIIDAKTTLGGASSGWGGMTYKKEGLLYQGYIADKNPVEFLLDYCLNSNYGLGIAITEIDEKSWMSAAIACDRITEFSSYAKRNIFYGEEGDSVGLDVIDPKYMHGENADASSVYNDIIDTNYNGYDRQFILNTNASHIQNVNRMLSSIGASMPYIEGKFHLYLENAGDPENSERLPTKTSLPISAQLTEDNIVSGIVLKASSINDRFNSIKVDFADAEKGGQPNSIIHPDPLTDSAGVAIRSQYLTEDNNRVLEANFTFPGMFDKHTAGKYARLLLKKSRGQPTLSFTCNAIGINFIPGDFIRCNFEVLKINDVYRIIETSINTDHTVSLTAIKHDPEFYDITTSGNEFVARKDIMNNTD